MRLLTGIAASAAALLATSVHALPIFSWEDGTAQGWEDTNWSSPDWTDKSIAGFGATDGNSAYTFREAGAFNFGDQYNFPNASAPWANATDIARWNQLAQGNMLLMDFTVQGERLAPLDPNNGHYIAFWPAWNGPGGGFIGSYDHPADPGDGSVAQYQIVFAPEYFDDIRTRTMAWDYVAAGYDFSNLVATENPPGSGIWSNHFTLMHISQNSNTAGVRCAIDNMRAYRVKASDPTWAGGAAGNWSSAGSWANGVPNAVDTVAVLTASSEAATVVNLDSAKTVGSLFFNNIQRTALGRPTEAAPTLYTVNGTAALTLSRSGSSEASIVVLGGANAINAPLNLVSDTVIDLAADTTTGNTQGVPTVAGASLTVQNITLAAGKTLRTTSVGDLTINGTVTGGAGSALRINGRKAAFTAGASKVSTVGDLTVSTSSTLDIANTTVVVDYASADPSPFSSLRAAIVAGMASGKGIVASGVTGNQAIGIVDAPAGSSTGLSLDGSAVVIRLTLKGDVDLNRVVNFDDLLALAQNYDANGSGKTWANGDSDYNGVVNFDDLLPLAQNYGGSFSLTVDQIAALGSNVAADFALARSLVPEPTMLSVAAAALLPARRRRRD